MDKNNLLPENCNKAKCKSCIFGETPVSLTEARIREIYTYLSEFKASHICHTTNLTCYGALEFQARILHAWGTIEKPTVGSFLNKAWEVLKSTNHGNKTTGQKGIC